MTSIMPYLNLISMPNYLTNFTFPRWPPKFHRWYGICSFASLSSKGPYTKDFWLKPGFLDPPSPLRPDKAIESHSNNKWETPHKPYRNPTETLQKPNRNLRGTLQKPYRNPTGTWEESHYSCCYCWLLLIYRDFL